MRAWSPVPSLPFTILLTSILAASGPAALAQSTPGSIVLDNGQPGTRAVGSWSISGAPNPYGGVSLYSKTAGTSYEFAIPIATPGEWEVQLWWTQWPSRLAAVPVDIVHASGRKTVDVNQLTNGGGWYPVGTFTFGSSATITVRSLGVGSTCADAVRLVPASTPPPLPPPGTAIIIDNGDPGTSFTGSWRVSSAPSPWGASSLYTHQQGAKYRFLTSVPAASEYEVWLWWTQWPSRSEHVRVFIGTRANEAEQIVAVDQLRYGGTWILVAEHLADTEILVTVEGSNIQGISTSADAVKIVRKGPPPAEVIIDNREGYQYDVLDREWVYSAGTWGISGGPNPYGQDSVYSKQANVSFGFVYTPREAGTHEVFAWWTEWPSRDTEVRLVVSDAEGDTTLYVDQQANGGRWNSLGTYRTASDGGSIVVTVHSRGVGTTCADAVRFVRR